MFRGESELDVMSHHHVGHMETGPRFKDPKEKNQGIKPAIPGLVVQHVIH